MGEQVPSGIRDKAIKQQGFRHHDYSTSMVPTTASSGNLVHQVFCRLHANTVLLRWIRRVGDLGSVWTLEVFHDAGAPLRKLLHRCLVCKTKTNCLSFYRFWQKIQLKDMEECKPSLGTVWPWGCLMMRGSSKEAANSSEGTLSQSFSPMKWTDLAFIGAL